MLYPLKFKPRLKPRIWGGGKLGELGKQVPAGQAIGESWELSGVQDDLSVITNGFLKDNDLQEIIEVYMDEIVGEANYEKYGIESDRLSVGKTEGVDTFGEPILNRVVLVEAQ